MTNGICSGLFAGAATTYTNNYHIFMLVQGNTYTVMLNNEPFTTWQGQGYTSGYVGIMLGYEYRGVWIDNFTVRQVK